jgi:KAP family P-loop domain
MSDNKETCGEGEAIRAAAGAMHGHDAPITTIEQDRLGAGRVARAIHRVLEASPRAWSNRVALYGRWGTGKTSVLNLLEQLERSAGSVVVRISAWTASGETGVLVLLYDALSRALKDQGIEAPFLQKSKRVATTARRWSKVFSVLGQRAESLTGSPSGTAETVDAIASTAFEWFTINKSDVEKLTKKLGARRVVVFIDDLDRADPKVLPKTLLALREVLDWPRFSFVLAFDQAVVAEALHAYSTAFGDRATVFLEKVVDVAFVLPSPTQSQVAALAKDVFGATCPFVGSTALAAIAHRLPLEPRRIKSIARSMSAMSEIARRSEPGEQDWEGLLLHSILAEASHRIAAWVVQAATGGYDDWGDWISGEAEKEEKALEKVRIAVHEMCQHHDGADHERVVATAVALLKRWSHVGADLVLELVRLTYDEPTFTRKEAAEIFQRWGKDASGDLPITAIENAAKVGGVEAFEAAQDLLVLACSLHSERLEAMSSSETEAERRELLGAADGTVRFIEYLWSDQTPLVIQEAARSAKPVTVLIELVSRWVGWTRNPGEIELREREQRLAMAAVVGCDSKRVLFHETDPYWGDRREHADDKRVLMRDVQHALQGALTDELVDLMLRKDGAIAIASGADKLLAWFVESPSSPLYRVDEEAQKLVNLFSGSGLSEQQVLHLRSNAKLFLHQQLFQTRDGSWGGVDGLRQKHALRPQVILAAWRLVAQHPVPFRMIQSVEKLRRDLLSAGIEADLWECPNFCVRGGLVELVVG